METDPSRRVAGKPRNVIKILLIVLAVCSVLAILACGGIGFLVYRLMAPTSFPAPTEDYAEARKHFRTRLVHQGPAPQPGGPEAPPPRVEQLEYQSGGLHLKAWVNRLPGEQKKPAVLFLHGGFAFAPEDWDQSQPFRDAGFVVMTPILRAKTVNPGPLPCSTTKWMMSWPRRKPWRAYRKSTRVTFTLPAIAPAARWHCWQRCRPGDSARLPPFPRAGSSCVRAR